MTIHMTLDAHSAIRLAVALASAGGLLLLLARLLFGPLPKGND